MLQIQPPTSKLTALLKKCLIKMKLMESLIKSVKSNHKNRDQLQEEIVQLELKNMILVIMVLVIPI